MRIKHLGMLLVTLLAILLYNVLCYSFVNNIIEDNSKTEIINYLRKIYIEVPKYEYKKATYNSNDGTINVFIKVNSNDDGTKYYRFIMKRNDGKYNIVSVNNNIPAYVK